MLIYLDIKIPHLKILRWGILRFAIHIPRHNLYAETLLQKQLDHNKAYPSVSYFSIS